MMVLWGRREVNVKELGQALYLDSGAPTPLLRKLEEKGSVKRDRAQADGRELIVSLTERGLACATMRFRCPRVWQRACRSRRRTRPSCTVSCVRCWTRSDKLGVDCPQ